MNFLLFFKAIASGRFSARHPGESRNPATKLGNPGPKIKHPAHSELRLSLELRGCNFICDSLGPFLRKLLPAAALAMALTVVACAGPFAPNPTPYPTYTPYPTHTPAPTYTPYPTHTPAPTYTPYPTQTPASHTTYTPYPTPPLLPIPSDDELISDLIHCLEETPWLWQATKAAMAQELAEIGLTEAMIEEAEPEDFRWLLAFAITSNETARQDLIVMLSLCP